MALALYDRVQQTGTANTTVSFTLSGSVTGYQSFSVVGNGNTTYYGATDTSGNFEVGVGTYSTMGPTLIRTTILSSSNSGSAVTFSGTVTVFVTYPSGKSVNLNESGNVSALGTVTSGVWNGTTIPVAYGGTGVTASSGANSVVLRDANQNVAVNRLNQSNTTTTAAGGTTALTAASSYIHTLVSTGGQTYTLPDATTLATGVAFLFNNIATGTLTIQDYATATIGTIASGGAGAVFLTNNGTVGGTWDLHAYLPEGVTFGTNAFNLGTAVISGGTWQGGTIASGYGGTGLTTFTAANKALYSTSSSALVAGTLPAAAGGTGLTAPGTAGNLLTSNGSAWVSSAPSGSSYTRTSFTATGGQTTFSVAYTVGFVQVYLNGVFLNGTDFTATNGTSVVLTTGATAGDIVETIAFTTSEIVYSTATNLAGGTASQIPYQSGSGTTAFIANGTAGQVLTSNGTSVPSFQTPAASGATKATAFAFAILFGY